jgi:hypothetical protein
MIDREFGSAGLSQRQCCIERQAFARIERQLQTCLQIKEYNSTVFKLSADDTLSLEA